MVLYCTNCMCYCPISTLLHLNLALTGETVHFCFPPKNELCMIYKHIELWGHWKCPNKSPSSCNKCHTHVIIQICVLINHINMHTHTNTQSCFSHFNFTNVEESHFAINFHNRAPCGRQAPLWLNEKKRFVESDLFAFTTELSQTTSAHLLCL